MRRTWLALALLLCAGQGQAGKENAPGLAAASPQEPASVLLKPDDGESAGAASRLRRLHQAGSSPAPLGAGGDLGGFAPATSGVAEPSAMAARIQQHRQGTFTVAVNRLDGSPAAVTDMSLTLARHDFPWGTAIAPEAVKAVHGQQVHDWYMQTVADNFWGIVPEVAFQWQNFEASAGRYAGGVTLLNDQYIGFAKRNGFKLIRGHSLVWGDLYGPCASGRRDCHFSNRGLNCSAYRQALLGRISRDVGIFRGGFTTYDVVNELVHKPGMFKACPDGNAMVVAAFVAAAQTDSGASMCLNEWGLLDDSNTPAFVQRVKDLLAAGAPIQCLGVQGHLQRKLMDPEVLWARLDAIAALGLPIHITELSLASLWNSTLNTFTSSMSEAEQAARLEQLVTVFFSHPAVQSITIWGFWDGKIWTPGCGIYRRDGTPKLAAGTLSRLWRQSWNTSVSGVQLNVLVAPAATPSGPAGGAGASLWSRAWRLVQQAARRMLSLAARYAATNAGSAYVTVPSGSTAQQLQLKGFYGLYRYNVTVQVAPGVVRSAQGQLDFPKGSPSSATITLPF